MNKKWLIIIGGIILLFILFQSILPQSVSAHESEWLRLNLFNPIVHFFGGTDLSQDTVREGAHSFEFGLLALFVVFLWNGSLLRCIYTGFTIAFLDETLQMFTGRGAEVRDIWYDMIGVAIGTGIGFLIYWLRLRKNI